MTVSATMAAGDREYVGGAAREPIAKLGFHSPDRPDPSHDTGHDAPYKLWMSIDLAKVERGVHRYRLVRTACRVGIAFGSGAKFYDGRVLESPR